MAEAGGKRTLLVQPSEPNVAAPRIGHTETVGLIEQKDRSGLVLSVNDVERPELVDMSRRRFVPEPFAVGLFALGIVLMFFPSLRVAGLTALLLGVTYWLLIAVLEALRRR